MIPWVHYVVSFRTVDDGWTDNQPVQVDYSDLYNIMSFFSGSPSHDGTHTTREAGNDDLARAIA